VEPPKDPETYIHRSGRTGRAGHTGVSIVLVGRKHEDRVPYIEAKAGLKFIRIGPPQPQEMARIAAERAVESMRDVDKAVVPWFTSAAEALLAEFGSPVEALSLALAKITGHTALRARSLLTASDDYVTMLFTNDGEMQKPGYVFGFLRRRMDEAVVEEVKRMQLTADARGAVFDVPAAHAKAFLEKCGGDAAPNVSMPHALPELKAREGEGGGYGGGGGGYGGGGYGGGRGGGRDGRQQQQWRSGDGSWQEKKRPRSGDGATAEEDAAARAAARLATYGKLTLKKPAERAPAAGGAGGGDAPAKKKPKREEGGGGGGGGGGGAVAAAPAAPVADGLTKAQRKNAKRAQKRSTKRVDGDGGGA